MILRGIERSPSQGERYVIVVRSAGLLLNRHLMTPVPLLGISQFVRPWENEESNVIFQFGSIGIVSFVFPNIFHGHLVYVLTRTRHPVRYIPYYYLCDARPVLMEFPGHGAQGTRSTPVLAKGMK